MNATVVIDAVSKRYGSIDALRDVSFALAPGEIVALVGHNGAGKTTLMKLMLGLVRPTTGHVTVLDTEPGSRAIAARQALGYLPENVGFNDGLTGRETLAFYARLKRQRATIVADLLDRVGLAVAAGRRVVTYSKGMRQRLGLAQAILGEPRLLLLDEPTSGLDPEFRQRFYDLMHGLRERGTTVLMSSHALTELEERADRAIIMNQGRIIAAGTLLELRRLARLPSRIVVRTEHGRAPEVAARLVPADAVRRINGYVAEFVCTEEDKMSVIRRIAAEGVGIADVDMVPPGLDELYAHFLRASEADT